MSVPDIAVLSYHGWEIDPDRLHDDVASLRAHGWRDLSLDDLETAAAGRLGGGRCFHVTIDDGGEGDRECVDALRRASCPATLFVSLDAMTDAARLVHRALARGAGIAVEDHSLRHNRAFHYRHVIGFHSDNHPLLTSPDRLGLRPGDPVCAFGGELARPAFLPDPCSAAICRAAATDIDAAAGTAAWQQALARALTASGIGFRRLGRLCVAGAYESPDAFRDRVRALLQEGRDRLTAFLGRAPRAFAHPWWEPSPVADECLAALGYRLMFSGRGMHRDARAVRIPRLFVSNDTPRPLDPYQLAARDRTPALSAWIRDAGRRALFA